MSLKPLILLILLIFITLSTSHSFNLTGPQTKLLTWVNSKGVQQNLLLAQTSVDKRTLLTQRATFPYDFETDDNCLLSESLDSAILYEPNNQILVKIQYTHMQGNDIMSKNTIELTHETAIKLTDEFTLKLSTHKPQLSSSQTQAQPPQPQTTNKSQKSSENSIQPQPLPLYLYNNQSLLQIDSKLYSSQPTCYMLSRMTQQLCLQQTCATLSPLQMYDMEIGPVVKDFVLVNGIITIKENSQKDWLVDSGVFGEIVFTESGESVSKSINVKEEIINLSGTTILTVKFQVSTINVPAQKNDLRRVGQSPTQSRYNITIIISNPNQVFAIKTINLYKGKQLILSDRLIIKPSHLLTYDTQWNGDKVNLPAVDILNQQLQVQGRYSLNFEITGQKTEEQVLANSNQQIIPEMYVQEVTIEQNHEGSKLPMIIAIAAGAGTFLLTVVVIWMCRKRIVKKCFSAYQQNQKQKGKPQIKVKQQECDKKESGRQLQIEQEITFEKKPDNIVSLPTSSTLHRQSMFTVENPQNKTQNFQCSFGKQLPVFSKQTSSIIIPQAHNNNSTILPSQIASQISQKQKSITTRMKSQDCVSKEESLSISSKWDESYTRKRISKKRLVGKQKEQEQTERI